MMPFSPASRLENRSSLARCTFSSHSAWRETRSGLVRGRDGVVPAAARFLQALRAR